MSKTYDDLVKENADLLDEVCRLNKESTLLREDNYNLRRLFIKDRIVLVPDSQYILVYAEDDVNKILPTSDQVATISNIIKGTK